MSDNLNIEASVYSPDGKRAIHFEASHYFSHLSDDEIAALAARGFCRANGRWGIASMAPDAETASRVVKFVRESEDGSECRLSCTCHVDILDALTWIERHRPQVFLRIMSDPGSCRECDLDEGEAQRAYRRVSAQRESDFLKKKKSVSSSDCDVFGL